MIVVDTNVIAYLLIPGDRTVTAELISTKEREWVAPYLWRSEFRNILALYIRQNIISLDKARQVMAEAENLMLNREFAVDSADVLELAKTSACSAYDCEFGALAKKLGVKLVTSDKKLIAAFPSVAVSMVNYS